MYSGAGVSGNNIPSDSFLFLTKVFNYHWYPIYSMALNTKNATHLLPTISIMMLYVIISCTNQCKKNILSEIHILVLALAGLTLVGIIASFYENIFLIKMSLHRASNIMVVFALVPIIIRLWNDIFNETIYIRCLSIYLLFSPFFYYQYPGFSLIFSLIYATRLLVEIKHEGNNKKITLAYFSWIIGLTFLVFSEHNEIFKSSYMGIIVVISVGLFITLKNFLLPNYKKNNQYFLQILCLFLMLIFTIKLNVDRTSHLSSERNKYYYQTQLWAKNNTKKGTLFMLDPNLYGGWRDISQRASYGTNKEWLHNAWLYNTNLDLYKEGLRRASIFNPDLSEIIKRGVSDVEEKNKILKKLKKGVRKSYYTPKEGFYKNLSDSEKIDFFVFENRYLSNKPMGLEEVYKNKYFSIYK